MATYEYQPLSTPTSFRVIVLKPAILESQPLEVELHEACLGKPHYEALSYTWGQRHGTIPIRCYDAASPGRRKVPTTTILITPNCESALRHLRHRIKARQLWIDAICIDQGSVAEKNQQVPLMGEIYMSAARTVIWLGPGEPGDAGTLSRAKTAGALVHFRTMPGYSALNDKEKAWARKILSVNEVERIGRICQSDWFQRIWTFQEYLLTEGGAVFMVGRAECPVSKLYTYFIIGEALHESDSRERRLFRMRSLIMEDLTEVRDYDGDSDSDDDDKERKKRKKKKKKAEIGWMSSVTSNSGRPPGGGLHSMLSLTLQMAAMSDATDPRDKVYGMLAYIDALHSKMHVPTVDYAKSLQDIFEEFAVCMIRSGESLWPLDHIAGHLDTRDDEVDRPWPSWVPDLRQSQLIASPVYWCSGLKRNLKFNEGGVGDERAADTPQGHLKLRGRRMTRVREVYSRMPEVPIEIPGDERQIFDDFRVECLSEWSAHAVQLDERTRRLSASGVERETYAQVLVKLTPSLGYLRQRHEPSPVPQSPAKEIGGGSPSSDPSLQSLLRDLLPRKAPLERKPPKKYFRQRRFDDLYDGSTLFLTECGLLGLCRGDVRAGDRIYQLAGGIYPCILRRVRGSRPSKYRFIGVASLDLGERAQREGFWYEDIAEFDLDDIVLV